MSFVGETLLETRPTFRSGAGPVASGREAGCGVHLGQKGPVVLTEQSEMHFSSAEVPSIPLWCAERKAGQLLSRETWVIWKKALGWEAGRLSEVRSGSCAS